jgi:hypothetical protein
LFQADVLSHVSGRILLLGKPELVAIPCIVTQSSNAKQCAIYVTYASATGDKVLGVPVTIATMNGEGMFTDVDGPLLLQKVPGKVVQYSGILPNADAANVAIYIGRATATSTLFVVTTPDGLRAQSTFA